MTHFYTAPTAIRALMSYDLDFVKKYDLSSLKVLGSVGSLSMKKPGIGIIHILEEADVPS